MNQLAVISDSASVSDDLRRKLSDLFELRAYGPGCMFASKPERLTLFDVSLKDSGRLLEMKEWLAQKPKDCKAIFIVDKASRIEEARAHAIGATDVVHRPIDRGELLNKIWGDFADLAGEASDFPVASSHGAAAAFDALQNIFSAACLAGRLDPEAITSAGDKVVAQIGAKGLTDWIEAVRKHHSQTYQHCMLVTGIAVAFGQHLGIGHKDRLRLSFAGMLHDIGKARIPVPILEKPAPLDQDEMEILRQHPQLGVDALTSGPSLPAEMLDMVLHHHEYLDGTGYPHGLKGTEISDLVRIVTIADVFAALIEKRAYKPPLSGEAAYKIMIEMGPKLDKDLLREFRTVAHLDRAN